MNYKQKDLIRMVSEESGYYQGAIKDIYDATFRVIERIMSSSTPDELNTIKLFEGLNLSTKFYKGKLAMKPRTGEKVITEDHIYPIAKFTQAYQLKIRSACKENNEDGE